MLTPPTQLEHLAHFIHRRLPPKFGPDALEVAKENGLIGKADLVDGALYVGWCRNAGLARWHADTQRFVYQRTKFGSTFEETIVHPEDDEGFDIFVPVGLATGAT